MSPEITIRPIEPTDFDAWKPLWEAYKGYYARADAQASSNESTLEIWKRFFNSDEAAYAFVAVVNTPRLNTTPADAPSAANKSIVALVHYSFHRDAKERKPVCHLCDLIVEPEYRGQHIAAALIRAVYAAAAKAGSSRVVYRITQNVGSSSLTPAYEPAAPKLARDVSLAL